MSEWIEWKGGECPVEANELVDFKFRDGEEYQAHAWFFLWEHVFGEDDIIAYRIIKEKE
ncbi:hypothetical protein ACIPEN_14455 [Herbaspirillum chlorophenolicum]|uniref:Uncharacterized protein n=1 Tax=Herbaspirillum chlorophenolicum TaxID=211589 RepID=A0ABW8F157_9BURK